MACKGDMAHLTPHSRLMASWCYNAYSLPPALCTDPVYGGLSVGADSPQVSLHLGFYL